MISRRRHANQTNGEPTYSYDDPLDQKLALFCIFRNINLSQVDNFLESFEDKNSPAFKELMFRRERARDGVKGLPITAGSGKGLLPYSFNSILRDLEFILMRMRELSIFPLAQIGQTLQAGRQKGGIKTAALKKEEAKHVEDRIIKTAKNLLITKERHSIVSILEIQYELSDTRIRAILKKYNI
jgi:hypothetical protein